MIILNCLISVLRNRFIGSLVKILFLQLVLQVYTPEKILNDLADSKIK